ncbi:EF-P beta-lysylation protein EpmB [Nevskia soli]|uniref:EF-P beta-lysylation protein EpmB n=1 Tax=Nevskia soli TaxID=418856 RepID=UPI0004A7681C
MTNASPNLAMTSAAKSKPEALFSLSPSWQRAALIGRPGELLLRLGLDPALPALDYERLRHFPLRVPEAFVARMHRGDPEDPLFLQVWPGMAEGIDTPGFSEDAVGDLAKLTSGGVIHKYKGRALLIATGACAVNCRYCFRRHFPYGDSLASRGNWQEALEQVAADPSIEEVILSGGDPLSLNDDKLSALVRELESIPHVRRLRLHTRTAVVLPERVDAHLLDWLGRTRLQKVIVLHVNHPNEIDQALEAAITRLRGTGATLLNQSVLLRKVNDSADILATLSERLFACGVLPYYLHLLDRVQGAGHFEVNENKAVKLMGELAARLPGYLVPRLAREEPGAPAKTLLPW